MISLARQKQFPTISNINSLGNRCSICLSYEVTELRLYARWHLIASEFCTMFMQTQENPPIFTIVTREKHGVRRTEKGDTEREFQALSVDYRKSAKIRQSRLAVSRG